MEYIVQVPTKVRTDGRLCDSLCSQKYYDNLDCSYRCRCYNHTRLLYNIEKLQAVRCAECLKLGEE